jgi:hypothetical protein
MLYFTITNPLLLGIIFMFFYFIVFNSNIFYFTFFITFVLGFNHHILGRLISDCSITSINDIVFVFDHIQLKIIIAFDKCPIVEKRYTLTKIFLYHQIEYKIVFKNM